MTNVSSWVFFYGDGHHRDLHVLTHSFPTRRSSCLVVSLALATLVDGHAWTNFAAICEAQGGMRTPPVAAQTHPIVAARAGRVVHIDNRKLARLAQLAGAPDAQPAGLHMETRIGEAVERGQIGRAHA